MLEWLIIGAGPQGTYMANLLAVKLRVPVDRIVIVDPNDAPCQRWKDLTGKTGMLHLRSPLVHHVDFRPDDLESFFGEQKRGARTIYGDNMRPSLEFFNSHIDRVVARSGIYRSYRIAKANDIRERRGYLLVDTNIGELKSRRVILAVSSTESLKIPPWASAVAGGGGFVKHVFDPAFSLDGLGSGWVYAVVGSGLTAIQLALSIVQRTGGRVHLVTKGAIDINELDFDPCWVGPKCQSPFQSIASYDERRRVVDAARNKGSVPPDAARALYAELKKGLLQLNPSRAIDAKLSSGGGLELHLEDGTRLDVDRIVLATGFTSGAPGRDWLPDVASNLGLPVHGDGFPLVDSCLRWHPRLFVTGGLAELEIGAAARNLIGARLAGERIERSLT